VTAAADYNPARVVLRDANVAWRGQAITASGTVGLKGRAPAINLVASSENISIADVLAGLNRADMPVTGTARFNAQVRGTTKQPEVDAQIGATDLVAYKEPLGTLNAQAQLRGDVLTIPELRLDKPQEGADGSLRAAATYNLQAKTYTLDAKSDNLRLTSLTLPDGRPVRAELNLNAQSQGTAENPTADLTLRADNVQVGADNFGSVALTTHLENQQARIQAAAPAFNLAATANVGVKGTVPGNV
jgi:autotransporter translocation and assembly factor TamB